MTEKISETKWEIEVVFPLGDYNSSIDIEVEIGAGGIEIENYLITWEELEEGKSILSAKEGET